MFETGQTFSFGSSWPTMGQQWATTLRPFARSFSQSKFTVRRQ